MNDSTGMFFWGMIVLIAAGVGFGLSPGRAEQEVFARAGRGFHLDSHSTRRVAYIFCMSVGIVLIVISAARWLAG